MSGACCPQRAGRRNRDRKQEIGPAGSDRGAASSGEGSRRVLCRFTRRGPQGRRDAGGPAWRRVAPAAIAALLPAGCTEVGAPAIPLFGAYFPSWLACALAGIFGAVLVRVVFIRAGIDDVLPIRLPVYVAVAAALGFLVSILAFGR